MTQIEKFLKEKHPEQLEEFKVWQAEQKKKAKEAEEAKLAKLRKTKHFWNYEFGYDVEFSYKGFSERTDTEYIPFDEAFRVAVEHDIGDGYRYDIITDCLDDLPTSPGMSFKEWLEDTGYEEGDAKTILFDMLYKTYLTGIDDYAKNSWDWEARVQGSPVWTGEDVFPKKHFDLVWKDFKKCRFMKSPEKDKD